MKPTTPLIVLTVAVSLVAGVLLAIPDSSAHQAAEETATANVRSRSQLPTLPPPPPTETATLTVTPTPTPIVDSCFPPAGRVAFYDDFDSPTLEPGWSVVREGPMDWSLTARPGYLRILTEAGDTDPDIPGAQILLLRPPVGNIDTISTNLEFDSTTDFVQGGLLVYQDDRNFLRLTSTVTFGQRIFFVWQHNGQVQSHFVSVEAGVLELRIEKQGNTYIGYYRTDGGLIEVGRLENVNLSNLRVGLGAWNGGGPPRILVDFDGFCLVSSPPTQTQTPTITPTATATSTARIYLPLIRQ